MTPSPPASDGAAGGDLALVLSGGAARGAYQAGVIRRLARRFPDLRFSIVTGVSAGAINASFIAAHPGPLAEAMDELCGVWSRLRVEDIFRVDTPSLARHFTRWATRLASGGENIADTHASRLFDLRIGIAERNAEDTGEPAPDGSLSSAHHPDKDKRFVQLTHGLRLHPFGFALLVDCAPGLARPTPIPPQPARALARCPCI